MIYHFFDGNILHLSPTFIERILDNALYTNEGGVEEHYFCITIHGDKMIYAKGEFKHKYEEIFLKYNISNYCFINSLVGIIKKIDKIKNSDKIFFHGSRSPFKHQLLLYLLLLMFDFKGKLSIMHLICWGSSDFYHNKDNIKSHITNFIYKRVFRRMGLIITLSIEDFNQFKALYPKANSLKLGYISAKDKFTRKNIKNDNIVIIISHSGWPHNNHIDSFRLIEKYKNENIKIICPLCYGDEKYIMEVVAYGKRLFSEKFTYFTELKSRADYIEIIQNANIFISSAEIQTGLFALTASLQCGLKVYATGNLYNSLSHYGFLIEKIDEISKENFHSFSTLLTDIEYKHNVDIYNQKYSNFDEIISLWRKIYDC